MSEKENEDTIDALLERVAKGKAKSRSELHFAEWIRTLDDGEMLFDPICKPPNLCGWCAAIAQVNPEVDEILATLPTGLRPEDRFE